MPLFQQKNNPSEQLDTMQNNIANINEKMNELLETNKQLLMQISGLSGVVKWDEITNSIQEAQKEVTEKISDSVESQVEKNNEGGQQTLSEKVLAEKREFQFKDKLMKTLSKFGSIFTNILQQFKPLQIIVNLFKGFFGMFKKFFGFFDKFLFGAKWFGWLFKTGHILFGWLYKYIILQILKGIWTVVSAPVKFMAGIGKWLFSALTPVLSLVFGPLIKGAGKFFGWLSKTPVGKAIGQGVKKVGGQVKKGATWLWDKTLGRLFSRKPKTPVSPTSTGEQQQEQQKQTTQQGGKLSGALTSISTFIQSLGTPQQLLGQVTLILIAVQFRILRPILETIVKTIGEVIMKIVDQLVEFTKQGFATFIETLRIQQDLAKQGPEVQNNFKLIQGGISQIQLSFAGFILAIGQANVLNQLAGFGNIVLGLFGQKVESPIDTFIVFMDLIVYPLIDIAKQISPQEQQIISILQDVVNEVQTAFQKFVQTDIKNRWNSFAQQFLGALVFINTDNNTLQLESQFTQFIDNVLNAFLRIVKRFPQSNLEKTTKIIDLILKVTKSSISSFSLFASSISKYNMNSVTTKISDFFKAFNIPNKNKEPNIADKFVMFVNDILKVILSQSKNVTQDMKTTIPILLETITNVTDNLQKFQEAVNPKRTIMQTLSGILSDLIAPDKDVPGQFQKFVDNILKKLVETAKGIDKKTQENIVTLTDVTTSMTDNLVKFKSALEGDKGFKSIILSIIDTALKPLTDRHKDINGTFQSFVDNILKTLKTHQEGIKIEDAKKISTLSESVKIITESFAQYTDISEKLKPGVFERIGEWFKGIWEKITSWFGKDAKSDTEKAKSTPIYKFFSTWSSILTVILNDVNISSLINDSNLQKNIVKFGTVTSVIDHFLSILENMSLMNKDKISNKFSNILTNLTDWTTEFSGRRSEFVKRFQGAITQILIFGQEVGKSFADQYLAVRKSVSDTVNSSNDENIKKNQSQITNDITNTFMSQFMSRGLLSGFQVGGFTGQGRPDEIQGVVHKGEYVIPQFLVNKFKTEIDKIEKERLKILVTKMKTLPVPQAVSSLLSSVAPNITIKGFQDGGNTSATFTLNINTAPASPITIMYSPELNVDLKDKKNMDLLSILLYLQTNMSEDVFKNLPTKVQNSLTTLSNAIINIITQDDIINNLTEQISNSVNEAKSNLDINSSEIVTAVTQQVNNIQNDYSQFVTQIYAKLSTPDNPDLNKVLNINLKQLYKTIIININNVISQSVSKSISSVINNTMDNIIKKISKMIEEQIELTLQNPPLKITWKLEDLMDILQLFVNNMSGLISDTYLSLIISVLNIISPSEETNWFTKFISWIINKLSGIISGSIVFSIITTKLLSMGESVGKLIEKSIDDIIKNVSDVVTNRITTMIDDIFAVLNIEELIDIALNIRNAEMVSLLRNQKQDILNTYGSNSENVTSIVDILKKLKTSQMIFVVSVSKSVVTTISTQFEMINFLFNNDYAQVAVQIISGFTGGLTGVLVLIEKLLGVSLDSIPQMIETSITETISKILEFIKDVIPTLFSSQSQYMKLVSQKQLVVKKEDLEKINQDISKITTGTPQAKTLQEQIMGLKQSMFTTIALIGTIVMNSFKVVFDFLNSILSDNTVQTVLQVSILIASVVQVFLNIELLKQLWDSLIEMFTKTLPNLITSILKIVTELIPNILNQVVQQFSGTNQSNISNVNWSDIVVKLIDLIFNVIGTVFNKILDFDKHQADYQKFADNDNLLGQIVSGIMMVLTPVLGIIVTILLWNTVGPITDLLKLLFSEGNVKTIVDQLVSSGKSTDLVIKVVEGVFNIISSVIAGQMSVISSGDGVGGLFGFYDPVGTVLKVMKIVLLGILIVIMGIIAQNIGTIMFTIANMMSTLFSSDNVKAIWGDMDQKQKQDLLVSTVTKVTDFLFKIIGQIVDFFFPKQEQSGGGGLLGFLGNPMKSVITILAGAIGTILILFIAPAIIGMMYTMASMIHSLFGSVTKDSIDSSTYNELVKDAVTKSLDFLFNISMKVIDYFMSGQHMKGGGGLFGFISEFANTVFDIISKSMFTQILGAVTGFATNVFPRLTKLVTELLSDTNITAFIDELKKTPDTFKNTYLSIINKSIDFIFNVSMKVVEYQLDNQKKQKELPFGKQLLGFAMGFFTGEIKQGEQITKFISDILTEIVNMFKQVSTLFTTLFSTNASTLISSLSPEQQSDILIKIVNKVIDTLFNTVLPQVMDVVIKEALTPKPQVQRILDWFLGLFGSGGNGLSEFSKQIQLPMLQSLKKSLSAITAIISTLMKKLTENGGALSQYLSKESNVKDLLTMIIGKIIDSIFTLFNKMFDNPPSDIKGTIQTTQTMLMLGLMNMSNAISNIIVKVSNSIAEYKIPNTVLDTVIVNITTSLSTGFSKLVETIPFENLIDSLQQQNIVTSMWNVLEQFAETLAENAGSIAQVSGGNINFGVDYNKIKNQLQIAISTVTDVSSEFEQQKISLMTEQNESLQSIQSDVQEIKSLVGTLVETQTTMSTLLSQIQANTQNQNGGNGTSSLGLSGNIINGYATGWHQ